MPTHSALRALDEAPVWLNSEPLTADALAGRVVLVDFWTYSCVNWLRTLPYLRAWHERYPGLTVVGAHAPEFGFEHALENVRWAVGELGIAYPVVIDNDFAIWRSFGNHYWPAVYLAGADGRVHFRHFGEAGYEETERAIQEQLGIAEPLADVVADGLSLAADWDAVGTPETYVGSARGDAGEDWSLTGDWSLDDEFARLEAPGGAIDFRFRARDLNVVLAGGPSRFTVTLDGAPPGDFHGVDTGPSGEGTLTEPRMYQLIRGGGGERTLQLSFHDPGARVYVFTFG